MSTILIKNAIFENNFRCTQQGRIYADSTISKKCADLLKILIDHQIIPVSGYVMDRFQLHNTIRVVLQTLWPVSYIGELYMLSYCTAKISNNPPLQIIGLNCFDPLLLLIFL